MASRQARVWTLEDLQALPRHEQAIDIHCVTAGRCWAVVWGGIPLAYLLGQGGAASCREVFSFIARSERNHSTSLPLATAPNCRSPDHSPGRDSRSRLPTAGRFVVPGATLQERQMARASRCAPMIAAATGKESRLSQRGRSLEGAAHIASAGRSPHGARAAETSRFSGRASWGSRQKALDLVGLNACGAVPRSADFRAANLNGSL